MLLIQHKVINLKPVELDWAYDDEDETDDYDYRTELITWAEGEIERHAMHRMRPALVH